MLARSCVHTESMQQPLFLSVVTYLTFKEAGMLSCLFFTVKMEENWGKSLYL